MYGISKEDIIMIDNKIDFQKEYLKRYSYDFIDNENEDFLKSTYSANLNPKKYFAEINNRVNSMVDNAKEQGLKPIFITITSPSKYHKKYDNGDLIFSPNETAKELTQIWNKFTNLQVFQRMRKDNYNITYFRVYEPHKSGVPHLHCLLFLPTKYILEVKKRFYNYFTDKTKWGANIGGIGFRYTWYKQKGGAVGYVMKYILKTFKNEDNQKIEYSVYWYIKNRVIRFLSSRTLCKLSLYRKVRYYFKNMFKNDLKEIKRLLDNGYIYYSFDDTIINYRYFDSDGELQDTVLWGKNTECVLHSRDNTDGRIHLRYKKYEKINNNLDVVIDGVTKLVYNKVKKEYKEKIQIPSLMKDIQLDRYITELKKDDIFNMDKLYVANKELEFRKNKIKTYTKRQPEIIYPKRKIVPVCSVIEIEIEKNNQLIIKV